MLGSVLLEFLLSFRVGTKFRNCSCYTILCPSTKCVLDIRYAKIGGVDDTNALYIDKLANAGDMWISG